MFYVLAGQGSFLDGNFPRKLLLQIDGKTVPVNYVIRACRNPFTPLVSSWSTAAYADAQVVFVRAPAAVAALCDRSRTMTPRALEPPVPCVWSLARNHPLDIDSICFN